MTDLLYRIFEISIQASVLTLVVLVLRILFKKAPKSWRCALWGLVALRLLLPFSLQSPVSLQPDTAPMRGSMEAYFSAAEEAIPNTPNGEDAFAAPSIPNTPKGEGAYTAPSIPALSQTEQHTSAAPSFFARIELPQILMFVWLSGIALLLIYAGISYLLLRRKTAAALRLKDNVFLIDEIPSPFVLGVLRPRICLSDALPEAQREHVIAHEQAHIRRGDHVLKPLAFLLASVYWFNPVLWLGYVLFSRDLELACDERVIRGYGPAQRAAYAETLLTCGRAKRSAALSPLAFGEVGVKTRVKQALSYKKPALWILVAAVLAAVVAAVCFLTEPKTEDPFASDPSDAVSDVSDPGAETGSDPSSAQAPPASFYSMTMSESYEKYGLFSFTADPDRNAWFDGKYYYMPAVITVKGQDGTTQSVTTLSYREYPDGKTWHPVCSDPLCSHTASDGCPLKGFDGFGFACYGGKIFFVSKEGVLYMYDPQLNRSTLLLEKCFEQRFIRSNGKLYLIYQQEDEDFNIEYVCCVVSADGTLTELGRLTELFTHGQEVYADKYVLDGGVFTLTDEGYRVEVILRDLQTGAKTTAFEKTYSEIAGYDEVDVEGDVSPYMVYGSKLLLRARYTAKAGPTEKLRNEFWLVDLENGEQSLLTYTENPAVDSRQCLYSETTVCYAEPRQTAEDPFFIHLLNPVTGTDEKYDLSAFAAKEGAVIPPDQFMVSLNKGALLLMGSREVDATNDDGIKVPSSEIVNTFEFDLKSGRVFQYSHAGAAQ